MITPTVGRVVWYFSPALARLVTNESKKMAGPSDIQPLKADIAYVHGHNLINIGYLDAEGRHHNATGVPLLQDDDAPVDTGFCVWMPYQKGQAAKTEAAESLADARRMASAGDPLVDTAREPANVDKLRAEAADRAERRYVANQEASAEARAVEPMSQPATGDNPAGMTDAELDRDTAPDTAQQAAPEGAQASASGAADGKAG